MKALIPIFVVLVGVVGGYVYVKSSDTKESAGPEAVITGVVLLGPTCPVMHEGDDSCADKPYLTTVTAAFQKIGGDKTVVQTSAITDENGRFQMTVPADVSGTYILTAKGELPFPRCSSQTVEVAPNETFGVDIFCDSGIR